MALINSVIPQQNFEVVRDQIATILVTELNNQAVLDTSFTAPQVWIDRSVPFDKSEYPAVNVWVWKADYGNQSVRKVVGEYNYCIDVYANSPAIGEDRGDKLAGRQMMNILGKCRAILSNQAYATLGYERGNINNSNGGIEHSSITTFKIMDKGEAQDALASIVGRIMLLVRMPEMSPLGEGHLCNELNVRVVIQEAENGYMVTEVTDNEILDEQGNNITIENIPQEQGFTYDYTTNS